MSKILFLFLIILSFQIAEGQNAHLISSNVNADESKDVSITFNPENGRFFILWRYSPNFFGTSTLRGRIIESDGTLGPIRQYSKPNSEVRSIHLTSACCTREKRYVITWSEFGKKIKNPVHTRLIDFEGRPTSAAVPLRNGGFMVDPKLAYQPLSNEFMYTAIGTYFARLDSTGRKINPANLVLGLSLFSFFSNPENPGYLAITIQDSVPGIFLRRIHNDGSLDQKKKKLFDSRTIWASELHPTFKEIAILHSISPPWSGPIPLKFQRFKLNGERIGVSKILTNKHIPESSLITATSTGYMVVYFRTDTFYSLTLNRNGTAVSLEKPILNFNNRSRFVSNISYDSILNRVLVTYTESSPNGLNSLWGMFLPNE